LGDFHYSFIGEDGYTTCVKTNAMRILSDADIPFEVITYDADGQHIDAMSVAHQVGLDPLQVCKTLVTSTESNAIFVFCVPAPYEISLKKARSVVQAKSLELVDVNKLRSLTGYIRGGVSPLGMIHTYPLYIEETVQLLPKIAISAGKRGMQLFLDPNDLIQVANGVWADLI
jgi:Cys-tRNA(Pro)/Cys-tRNA(Cys) deacylase